MPTIQELIDAAGAEDIVTVPPGTYDVDALTAPIRLKSGITLDLTRSFLNVIPNSAIDRMYWAIQIAGCQDVTIKGGTIVGDRNTHPLTPAGLGMGVAIGTSRNIKLQGVTCTNHQGDGVLVVDAQGVELDNVLCGNNRRQGMSVSQVNGLWVHGSEFSNTGGTQPGAGIDLEADLPSQIIQNVRIEKSVFISNQGAGVLIATPPAQRINIQVTADNVFVDKPIDGTDGIVPFWAKWLGQLFGKQPGYPWYGYPRELHLP